MIGKIWERYFIREIGKIFFLVISSFYGLYVLIDYSSRSSTYNAFHLTFIEIVGYYRDIFVERLEIFLPFAFLIAAIRTLCQLNIRNELIALRASGIKIHTLLRPFLLFSLLLTSLLYLNNEFLLPQAYNNQKNLKDAHFKEKYKKEKRQDLNHALLEDGTILIYHKYLQSEKAFFDLYWVLSFDKVLRMKYLFPFDEVPFGKFVDEFERQPSGELELKRSWEKKEFPHVYFDKENLKASSLESSQLSLSELVRKYFIDRNKEGKNRALFATALYYRIFMPWLCFIVFIAAVPFCLKFTRSLPTFFIYVCGMLATVGFYLSLHAAMILAEHQVINPFFAIGLPFVILLGFFGWRYHVYMQ